MIFASTPNSNFIWIASIQEGQTKQRVFQAIGARPGTTQPDLCLAEARSDVLNEPRFGINIWPLPGKSALVGRDKNRSVAEWIERLLLKR